MKLFEYLSKHGMQTELAVAVGAQPQLMWQWSRGVRPVPVSRCLAIERATAGAVTRKDLRPDDWQQYWPEQELAQAHASITQAATESVASGQGV